jgi:hypothetical protein
LLLVGGQKLARQTDGLGLVVSHRAVLELNVHESSLRGLLAIAFLFYPKLAVKPIPNCYCRMVES